MYPQSGKPAITPEIWTANEKFWRSVGEWDKPQSSSVIAYDLVNAGAAETTATTG